MSAGKLSDSVKERYSNMVSWSKIKGFRNFIYHNYGNLDFRKVKTILDIALPETEEQLRRIVAELEGER